MIATLEDAAAYLGGLINLERKPEDRSIRLGLDAIEALLARVDHPERRLSVLHVAGSKGKGSVCWFAEAILAALGERVGTFTSPHLERWTERFRVAGREVEGARLARAVERLRPHVEALRTGEGNRIPSFFDATTAAAFLLFDEAAVDRAVIEVGLGGRLDSTNVVRPIVTCITSIELEHTDRLGTSLSAIAREKAGILKRNVPCVTGELPSAAMRAVETRASALEVPLARVGRELFVEVSAVGDAFAMRDEAGFELEAELALLGAHHAVNAALAVACVRRLGPHSDAAVARVAPAALAACVPPGRCEKLGERPWLVVDSAHTPASARALRLALESVPAKRRHLVLSVSSDKALPRILDELLPGVASVIATRAEPHRSLAPDALASAIRSAAPGIAVESVEDPEEALREARARLLRDDLLVAAGSVYLAGPARRILRVAGQG